MRLRPRNSFEIVLLALAFPAIALATSGTTDSTYKYAWGNVAGYVNFAPTNSTITVSDSSLTGYAWSQNDGWIYLQPANGGVSNNGQGTLSGYAWDESQGWVSFSGVTIDSSGKFHGQATGSNGYAISFDCTYCDVRTAWRPATSGGSSGGGNGPPVGSYGEITQSLATTSPPKNPLLEPSTPPPTAASTNGTGQPGAPYYQLPTQGSTTASSITPTTHATSAFPVNTQKISNWFHKPWVWVVSVAFFLLLAFLLSRFIF